MSSEALRVAQYAGIPEEALKRASVVLRCLAEAKPIPVDLDTYPIEEILDVGDAFLDLDLDSEEFEPKMNELISRLDRLSTMY